MKKIISVIICFIFFLLYSTLSIVRHNNFGSFGFDLGITDQIVWEYAHFQKPLTTIQSYEVQNILEDHTEFIYAPLSFSYWVWDDARMILLLQAFFISFSGLAIFLLSRKYNLRFFLSVAIMISYLLFYGIQNAIWSDVHSLVFGAAFLSWYLYFLKAQKIKLSILTGFLAILSKENMPVLILIVSACFYYIERKKIALLMSGISVLSLFLLFGIYFPHMTHRGYQYQSSHGLIASFDLNLLFNTQVKQQIFLYSYGWFGFLPLLSPILLLPSIADLATYFLLGANVENAQTLFMHYRVTLAPLVVWPVIATIADYKFLQKKFTPFLIVGLGLFFQYQMHLPLSYLSKKWFWTQPNEVPSIEKVIKTIPEDASIVSQNNITPHISHRKNIYTLWPEKKEFKQNSPCGQKFCNWLKWIGNPDYLIVDIGPDWDIRHFLTERENFLEGLSNLEKQNYISLFKKENTTFLYKVWKQSNQ